MVRAYTIVYHVDRHRTRRLAMLLDMFRQNAKVPYKEVEKVMPRTTFYQLLYMLRLLNKYVHQKYGFRLFGFRRIVRADGRRAKVMQIAAEVEFTDIEGTTFVSFNKRI